MVPTSSAGFVGRPSSSRVMPRYARIMGRADGSIIATIITTSKMRKTASTAGFEVVISGIMSSFIRSVEDHVTYHATATAITTNMAIGAVRCRRRSGAFAVSVVKGPSDAGGRYERAPAQPER